MVLVMGTLLFFLATQGCVSGQSSPQVPWGFESLGGMLAYILSLLPGIRVWGQSLAADDSCPDCRSL